MYFLRCILFAVLGVVATTAAAVAAPSCEIANRNAVVAHPVKPVLPSSVHPTDVESVYVTVTIGRDGHLLNERIASSSNNPAVDRAVLDAVRKSTFSPRVIDCQPTTGTYLYYFMIARGGVTISSLQPGTVPTTPPNTGEHCSIPNKQLTVVRTPPPANPGSVQFPSETVVVMVGVTVNSSGTLMEAHIARSSYNIAVDQEALRLARQSLYSPKINNCVATMGTGVFPFRVRSSAVQEQKSPR
jgi:TonB family protein